MVTTHQLATDCRSVCLGLFPFEVLSYSGHRLRGPILLRQHDVVTGALLVAGLICVCLIFFFSCYITSLA